MTQQRFKRYGAGLCAQEKGAFIYPLFGKR